jgi:hypothetical protein
MIRKLGKRRPRTLRRKVCERKITIKAEGRVPTYCGQSYMQRAYSNRRLSGPRVLLARDIATAEIPPSSVV